MMTHLFERFSAGLFDVTLFEATLRLGGKVLTQRFDTIPAIYEAGVAELYDYSDIGLDPLKTLVQDLGLKAVPMHGHAVVLGDERYVEAAVRSDTATEPHLTSALNGLKNVLMDDPRYMRLYSIEGGIEKVVEGIVCGLKQTEIVRESRLLAIGRAPGGRYRLRLRNHDRTVACDCRSRSAT